MFNTKDYLLVMALPMESQGFFEKAGIQPHYCGIGKVNAAWKVTELILKNPGKKILNLGTAGSQTFATHDLVECTAYVQRDMDIRPLNFPLGETPMDEIKGKIEGTNLFKAYKHGVCGTGDRFEVGPPELPCDLVDMEAYAMAKVCKRYNVDFVSIKYITDGSDHNAHNDWQTNLLKGAQALLDFYQKHS